MLVDIPESRLGESLDPMLRLMAEVTGGCTQATRLGTGQYLSHLNWDHQIRDLIAEKWPEFKGWGPNCYGVCDTPEQLTEKFPQIEADPRRFVIHFAHISKKDQSPQGGWRWHKWGQYVGDGEPTCEYLYDEPGFDDGVYVYHIYEVKERQ